MTTTADKVCTLLTEHLACADRFSWEAELIADLGADSLDKVEIAMRLEQELGIRVSDDAADRWRTAGDVLATVEEG